MTEQRQSPPRPALSLELRERVSKDTRLCISLSGRPSDLGTRFHNFLYAELGLDFVYKASTTGDVAAAVAGIRALGIRGCGVSMPFKEAVIPLVDELTASAAAIDSVNTIVNDDGHLVAHNTDYLAVVNLLAAHGVRPDGPAVVLGSGGMAKACLAALRDGGFADLTVVARNEQAGPALAGAYGARWVPEASDLRPALLVNATPVGMTGGEDADRLPAPREVVAAAAAVVEVVAVPAETPLVRLARELGAEVVTGTEIAAVQAAEQFALYTGVRPTDEQVRRAGEFSRAR
ncbi:shikimate 5-dehydrogenase [Paenibacillus sp. TRM 82003]|uniref:shikimate 5-dehydrogenase n=1 Tax=Kineococcus sp. TRM81007 TaxID=2925831 RepID=UPI001F57FCB2|nr:shikimate 5-dehydrogenase [Kineococcus sp. TRM81007]MCI2240076.1 shikimate 5-dehydrogenase [Kineococcus sp. TRM81007]MCI3925618.1 shikimate 5-dehydrogenase [Paenibacillus sp. TRM 82003]